MIAITGANGLLGSFIARRLLNEGTPFVAIKRSNSDLSLLYDVVDKIQWRNADITDPVALSEALKDITHVIHAAAIVSFNPRDEEKIFNVNIDGTRQIADACLLHGVKRLVYISSVAALGRLKDQQTITEDNKWTESPLNSTYGQSKYRAELEIFRAQEEGLSTVIINPSVILAPADWDKSSAQLFKYVWKEKRFYIDGSLNYVDVRDVAEIVYNLVYASVEGERFIVNGGTISYENFFNRIASQFNKKPPSVKLSKKFLRIIAYLENVRAIITRATPLITPETARLADTYFNYDNSKIKKYLNLDFKSIDQTLAWCCKEYIEKINGRK